MRRQKTIQRPAAVRGFGLISGQDVVLRFLPAPEDTGIVFIRADKEHRPSIPAHISRRQPSERRTTLVEGDARVEMTEHVLAALRGLEIDNCIVEITGEEPPGGDGSSLAFVDALLEARPCFQEGWVEPFVLGHPVCVAEGQAFVAAFPVSTGRAEVRYMLDYSGHCRALGRQSFHGVLTPVDFLTELAAARTFLTASEAAYLRHLGWGSRATARDLLIFDDGGPVDNMLRYKNEPARHKALDIVGDVALAGRQVVASFVGYRSGHRLNAALAEVLCAEAGLSHDSPPTSPWIWPGVLRRSSQGGVYVLDAAAQVSEAVRGGALILAALLEWAGSLTGAARCCESLVQVSVNEIPEPGEEFRVAAQDTFTGVRVIHSGRVLAEIQMDLEGQLARAA